uniref:Neuropeptide-2 n=1 Tax=Schmidtea mediterranea TaxID=79327 RepID=E3CTL0_SCHMD|nr:TPA_inf: neuropeptide precursor-2 [Schmidtea mediterranea]
MIFQFLLLLFVTTVWTDSDSDCDICEICEAGGLMDSTECCLSSVLYKICESKLEISRDKRRGLIGKRRGLIGKRRGLIGKRRGLIGKRRGLIGKRRGLIGKRRGLIGKRQLLNSKQSIFQDEY